MNEADDIYTKYECYVIDFNTSKLSDVNDNVNTVDLLSWIDNTRKLRGLRKHSANRCPECAVEYITTSNGNTVCPECGMVSQYNFDTGYNKKSQSYKRMTHFKDWIIKTQAKHNPNIDPSVLEMCKNATDKTYDGIKNLLKQHNYTKHYEDIWYILSIINPSTPIFTLSPSEETRLYNLFMKVCPSWEQIKPLKRKSIISYPFIITELLDIINRPDLKVYFSLPRYNKILEYKTQWKRIMNTQPFCLSFSAGKIASSFQAPSYV
jgi:hypothetical protein